MQYILTQEEYDNISKVFTEKIDELTEKNDELTTKQEVLMEELKAYRYMDKPLRVNSTINHSDPFNVKTKVVLEYELDRLPKRVAFVIEEMLKAKPF